MSFKCDSDINCILFYFILFHSVFMLAIYTHSRIYTYKQLLVHIQFSVYTPPSPTPLPDIEKIYISCSQLVTINRDNGSENCYLLYFMMLWHLCLQFSLATRRIDNTVDSSEVFLFVRRSVRTTNLALRGSVSCRCYLLRHVTYVCIKLETVTARSSVGERRQGMVTLYRNAGKLKAITLE